MTDFSGWNPAPGHGDAPRRSAWAVVGIAVGVIALGLGILWASRSLIQTPLPTAVPAPSEPAATSAPPQPDEGQGEQRQLGRRIRVNALLRQVARIRGLRPQGPLRSRRVAPKTLADKVTEIAFGELDRKQVAADERLLIALRLAPADIDLAATLEALYREQVLGLYVPKEKTLYVRDRGEASAVERMTTAHEIAHALQDQHFDLVQLQEAVEDNTDSGLAVLSLIEGDAVLTQQLWGLRHLSEQEQREAAADAGGGGDALADAPPYLRASLFFPYQQGSQFVAALFQSGGFAAVDDAFANPPTTTEQILHPDRYQDGEGAARVALSERPAPEWRQPTTYDFGEFDLRELLRPTGDDTAETAATGWGGGRLRMWSRGGDVAVSAALAFDSHSDAAEGCSAIGDWYVEVANATETSDGEYDGDRDHLALRCTGDRVRFGLAPDPQTARRAAASP